jgi:hypothetical protein
MRCFPILGLTPSLDVFPSHWSHLGCAFTASISPPSLDGMDISHQHVPPHIARCISHRNDWSALLRCFSCPLDCSSQLGPTPHTHDTIQAIQHIHTTLSAVLTRSRLCAAVHYGITTFWRSREDQQFLDSTHRRPLQFTSVSIHNRLETGSAGSTHRHACC